MAKKLSGKKKPVPAKKTKPVVKKHVKKVAHHKTASKKFHAKKRVVHRVVHKPEHVDEAPESQIDLKVVLLELMANERSQAANRERAMQVLVAKLEALKEEEEAKKFSTNKKNQIGTGDRSEKIRTYNILQDRITDHRIKESWHNISHIFEGNLDPIVEALRDVAKKA
jgi:hypothetical protein